jgi:hypothetical protein
MRQPLVQLRFNDYKLQCTPPSIVQQRKLDLGKKKQTINPGELGEVVGG